MPQIIIDGNQYRVYVGISEASAYLAASVNADTWSATSEDDKARALVTSTRILDRQKWKPDWDTFEKRLAEEGIVFGSIELAALLASGEDSFTTNATTANSTKSLKAGSAEITYFKDFSVTGAGSRFPLTVMELLGQYLASTGSSGSAGIGGSFASGTGCRSKAYESWGLNRGL